ncbi:MAG: hypothetical protein IT327_29270 [Anaerolineae bacterium]|nr:hypothetical protein [Anaerolineae bacterium]
METGRTESRFLHPRIALVFSLILLTACQFFGTSSPAAQEVVTTLALSTPPVVVTPVPSPQPILSLAEKEALALEYYMTNGNCELPCWWGIVPGETEWQTAQLFLDSIALEISTNQESQFDQFFTANIYLPAPHELSNREELFLFLTVRSGKVVVIEPGIPHTPLPSNRIYTVAEILKTYGRPAEIKLDTYGYAHEGPNPFRIALYYPSLGILVRYGNYADFVDENVVGCIQSGTGFPVLWDPINTLTFAQALNGTRGLGTFGEQYYKPLEEATEMDVETFYQTYLDPDTETCIETPAELWMDR